jgi:fatty-acyl-CoA synthase
VLIGPAPPPPGVADLSEALRAAAAGPGGVTFVDAGEREQTLAWAAILERARRAAAALVARGIRPGDRVALVLRTEPAFLDAFFGALWAGAVPVPLYPPIRLAELARYRTATARMLGAVAARLVVADRTLGNLVGEAVADAGPALGLITPDALHDAALAPPRPAAADELALIQFSSGTTREPRPVALAHRQLVAHLAALTAVVAPPGRRAAGVSWLPLYHDMGLIGCLLGAAYVGGSLVLIPPEVFLARPALWLRAIGRHRATVSPAPSFAYGLCARRVGDDELAGVDLSSWQLALDGAEQVSAAAARRFAARFASVGFDAGALVPVYGLAEATLAVSFAPPGRGVRTLGIDPARAGLGDRVRAGGHEVASVGAPVPGVAVAVWDARGRPLPPGQVGRIAVRGAGVMAGYFGQPEATAAVLAGGWLDTGDLGFVADGELFVCGRARDLVVVRGVNHHPAELESALDGVAGARPGCAVALGVAPPDGDSEELVVVVERRAGADRERLTGAIRAALVAATGLWPHDVVIVEPGTLPRTSSGKLRRGEARRRLLAGELTAPRPPGRLRLALHALRSRWALARLGLRHGHG